VLERFVWLVNLASDFRIDLGQRFSDPSQLFAGQAVQDAVPKAVSHDRLDLHIKQSSCDSRPSAFYPGGSEIFRMPMTNCLLGGITYT
jgi:hypothetical protein